jgi:hypothetical protein
MASPGPQPDPATLEPNFYRLHGQQITVTYTKTSFVGGPSLSYHGPEGSKSFSGDQIRTAETEIGTLVTVTILPTVDAGSTTFTVLLPHVVLTGFGDHETVNTYGITTRHLFSIIIRANVGQRELYHVTPLTGTAQIVEFLAQSPSGAGGAGSSSGGSTGGGGSAGGGSTGGGGGGGGSTGGTGGGGGSTGGTGGGGGSTGGTGGSTGK